ncbi:DUF305 domain-containing protein [Arthrobacter cryoconiti]|uniref:DUF305 domain-containing protein n=1 Tax=Arthrobacter cryoconiti TaxID=748907 RepID=A0ABV8R449_9MICC|nr:DUF305 domain-containing protein [Arthrobacter cryoconiti]MCC9069411.1 DUF305 domain-containing protein [Arthrobacter cryoconiti]
MAATPGAHGNSTGRHVRFTMLFSDQTTNTREGSSLGVSYPAFTRGGREVSETGAGRARRNRLWIALVAVLVLTAVAFFAMGRLSAAPTPIADSGADAGFARDMQSHHAQAVEMALVIWEKSANPEIRAVAYDIAISQQQQNGQLFAWLRDWGLPQSGSAPPMAWMAGTGRDGSSAHSMAPGGAAAGGMEGMATAEQMQMLREASGAEADRLFTDMMIRHHQGGVAMANAAVRLAKTSKVRDFAALIVEAQTAEIAALQELRGRL